MPTVRPCSSCGESSRSGICRPCWLQVSPDQKVSHNRGTGRPKPAPETKVRQVHACSRCGIPKPKPGDCRTCWRRSLVTYTGCLVPGCTNSHHAKGHCTKHWHRITRHGDVDQVRLTSIQLVRLLPQPAGDCIEWARRGAGGYGKAWFDGRHWKAHRLVWTQQVGPIPDGMELDHLCVNAACVNIAHLELVTPGENKRRRWARWWARQEAA